MIISSPNINLVIPEYNVNPHSRFNMSWFTELASKAEAMLVKLDQDTAQVLQITTPQDLTRAIVPDSSPTDVKPSAYLEQNQTPVRRLDVDPDIDTTLDYENLAISHQKGGPTETDVALNGLQEVREISNNVGTTDGVHIQELENQNLENLEDRAFSPSDRDANAIKCITSTHDSSYQSRKFKLQTSKLKPTLYNGEFRAATTLANGSSRSSKRNIPVISLGADDIRASINRSVQEYSQSSSYDRLLDDQPQETSYSSHFDDQPIIVSKSPDNNNDQFGRLHASPSFSISVPDDQATDITSRILKQSALNKKSPFNLHKVINRLASHRGHSYSLLGDKTKIRLRRAQLRAASYLRRMNYYFQAYPTMKYWMIGYLVLLQILVVYVLFFYQSSGSASYLTNQVKQQQQELVELSQHSDSERIHPYPSDHTGNNFR